MTDIHGYKGQPPEITALANESKELEERVLRFADKLKNMGTSCDQRRVSIGVTDIEKGFMQFVKAITQPSGSRLSLPEDGSTAA